MKTLDCSRFQTALADALASAEACDPATAEVLRAHAGQCTACAGSSDLVELASRPAAVRDLFPDPPPSYWERFTEELAARIARERERRRRGQRYAALSALAAAILAAAVLFRAGPFRSATPRPLPPVDEPVAGAEDAFGPFPGSDALGGFSEDDEPSLFGGEEELTPEGQERLLEWLKRERERATGGPA